MVVLFPRVNPGKCGCWVLGPGLRIPSGRRVCQHPEPRTCLATCRHVPRSDTIKDDNCASVARILQNLHVESCQGLENKGVNHKLMASNNYSQGAQVEHDKFGLGTVLTSNEERIVIKFDDHGEKKFVTPMVMGQLKKSDRQPPAEKRASRARKPKAAPAPVH